MALSRDHRDHPLYNKLTDAERSTDTWQRLQKMLTRRLQELREFNDNSNDEAKTANTRGRIAMIKELLDMAAERESFEGKR